MENILAKCKYLVLSLLFVFAISAVNTPSAAAHGYSSQSWPKTSSQSHDNHFNKDHKKDVKHSNKHAINKPKHEEHKPTTPKNDCPQPQTPPKHDHPKPQQPPKHENHGHKPKDHNPMVKATANGCVPAGQKGGSITVTVTNHNSKRLTYLVSVGNNARAVTLESGKSETLTFTDLTAGKYVVTVYENGCKKVVVKTTIETCPPTPVTPGRGGEVLGETTTVFTPTPEKTLANTGESSLFANIAAFMIIGGALVASRMKLSAKQS